MRAILNVLNFILGGAFTTLAWLLAAGYSRQYCADFHSAIDTLLLGNHPFVTGPFRQ